MSSIEVDGAVLPVGVGGHPALDFCNTRAGWGAPAPKEYLLDHRHLTVWAQWTGLISPEAQRRTLAAGRRLGGAAEAITAGAIDLRTSMYEVFLGNPSPRAWLHVSTAAAAAAAMVQLERGTPSASWVLPEDTGAELPVLALALAAADLMTSPLAGTVAACPQPDCGWLFADPRGRRTWCSMAVCGNRVKARRYASRHRV